MLLNTKSAFEEDDKKKKCDCSDLVEPEENISLLNSVI